MGLCFVICEPCVWTQYGGYIYSTLCFESLRQDAEIGILTEMTHLQDVINALSGQANNSSSIPLSIEQVMLDLKGKESTLSYKVRYTLLYT